ncbi:MAG: hypothetical protein WC477_00345 [Patescibacteria group bacterium]
MNNDDCRSENDADEEYRPEYIQYVLDMASEPPTHVFKDAESFLRDLESV